MDTASRELPVGARQPSRPAFHITSEQRTDM